jgi:hypothetical protein
MDIQQEQLASLATPVNICADKYKSKAFYYIGIILSILVILFLTIFLTYVLINDLVLIKKPTKIQKQDDDNVDEYTRNYNYVNQNYNIDIDDLNRY